MDVLVEGRELHLIGAVVREGDERERALAAYLRRFPRAAEAVDGAVVVAIEPAAPPR